MFGEYAQRFYNILDWINDITYESWFAPYILFGAILYFVPLPGVIEVPVLIVGVAALFYADPTIPWFGRNWRDDLDDLTDSEFGWDEDDRDG